MENVHGESDAKTKPELVKEETRYDEEPPSDQRGICSLK